MLALPPGLGRRRAALAACVMLSVLAIIAVLAPWVAPADPLAQSRADSFRPPSFAHPFGADEITRVVTGYNALAMTVPTFWLGILLVLCFALWLKWLPASGFVPFWEEPARALRFLALPAVTLGAHVSVVLARFTRAALLETLYQDYVRAGGAGR